MRIVTASVSLIDRFRVEMAREEPHARCETIGLIAVSLVLAFGLAVVYLHQTAAFPADLASRPVDAGGRSPAVFRRQFFLTIAIYYGSFWSVHLVRRAFHAIGDGILLPCVMQLTGISLIALAGFGDPLRDALYARSFALGVALACAVLAAMTFIDVDSPTFRRATLWPLALAIALAVALVIFGTGPGASGVKLKLYFFQPVEVMRVLAILALASYFSRRWELLRDVSMSIGPVPWIRRLVRLPRARDIKPLIVIVGTLITFFFLQRDLGPALMLGAISLTLYGVARGRAVLSLTGFATLSAGFAIGYALGVPAVVARRVAIWIDPWHNGLVNGDQIAHGLWALATGAGWGVGAGAGLGRQIPAGETDLILAVIGEELGFAGMLVILGLYTLLIARMLRISARAPSDYTAFLGLGCALAFAVPGVLIAGGLLGLLPLSGVVTPFLSFGKSSMFCNFVVLGLALAISQRTGAPRESVARQFKMVQVALTAVLLLIGVRIFYVQVMAADEIAVRPTLVTQKDGTTRYQYNPRLHAAIRLIPRGTIYDRRGLALATSDAAQAAPLLARLKKLRAAAIDACPAPPLRCYPLGAPGFHAIGDATRQTNWAARNASFVERDANATLQGFDDRAETVLVRNRDGRTHPTVRRDYRDLLPIIRHPGNLAAAAESPILQRSRDVHVTLDGPFQALVAQALAARARDTPAARGAVVVVDAATGALVAAVSYPYPQSTPGSSPQEPAALLDRARYGQYPPGSIFKLVTAGAALNVRTSNRMPTFVCERLPDGRVGKRLPGFARDIRDDVMDKEPHGRLDLHDALVHSCNAYFAQLAVDIGAPALAQAADAAQLQVAATPVLPRLANTLPTAGYGQGEVLATPLRMARVVAAIASDGVIRDAPLVTVAGATSPEVTWLNAADAQRLAATMRDVVTSGTARSLAGHPVSIGGKTGTAQVAGAASHSWFVGFAPADRRRGRIAFAVILENAGYGGRAAATLAGDVVDAASRSGLMR